MDSSLRSPRFRSPGFWLLVLAGLLCLGNLWYTLARSTIPLHLKGEVSDIDVLSYDEDPANDIYILHIGKAEIQVDKAIAERFSVGSDYEKGIGSRCIKELEKMPLRPQRCRPINPSRDFWGMVLTMPVVLGAGAMLVRRRRAFY